MKIFVFIMGLQLIAKILDIDIVLGLWKINKYLTFHDERCMVKWGVIKCCHTFIEVKDRT